MMYLRWLFSKKHYEIKIVLATLLILMTLPLISVVVLASSGISIVSSALAQLNPSSQNVSIFDPNGQKVADIQAITAWPVHGVVTLEFGAPDPPYQVHHTGIDIANPHSRIGDPVTTFMDGTVLKTNDNEHDGCGRYVEVDHGDHILSLYCHLSVVVAVKGQVVKPGDIIGLEGETGDATGPHVHFQVMVYGVPVNPRTFVAGDPTPEPTL